MFEDTPSLIFCYWSFLPKLRSLYPICSWYEIRKISLIPQNIITITLNVKLILHAVLVCKTCTNLVNVLFPQNMHKVGQSTNMVFIWSSSHTKKTQSHRISSCMWCHFNALSKETSEEKWKMFHRYFLPQSYQLGEETFLLTSKQDKLKHPFNKVMTIPTQASEMRHARNKRLQIEAQLFQIQKHCLFT